MSASALEDRPRRRRPLAPTYARSSRQTLYDIIDEKQPITAQMALRLGKLCGDGGRIWLAMQVAYDLAVAEREMVEIIAAIPTLAAVA